MNVNTAIRKRRSIRKFKDKVPTNSEIKKILTAGIWAPSGLNNQPWKFIVIKDKEKRRAIAKYTSSGSVIKRAPVAICVFLDKKAAYNREKDILAIGACIQNMLLSAYNLGLATCWLGEILNKKKRVENYLKTGPQYELMAVIALGYPNEKEVGERKPLNSYMLNRL